MGRKGRRTRWRTLTIDGPSDSEDSNDLHQINSTTNHLKPHLQPYYHHLTTNHRNQKNYYTRYSSLSSNQSTPTRRFINSYDNSTTSTITSTTTTSSNITSTTTIKSTRSSSTASENKITFNEDEYTRITTPRQDVLFKKGYLNKPKNYQNLNNNNNNNNMMSNGNSTTTTTNSTGNSTENCTPDHQSTDLEYESQFIFPNAFVDQNGICYVNSYEPYPLMLYNPPTYYHDFAHIKTKRASPDSLADSSNPNNDDNGQIENGIDTTSDYGSNGNPTIYNVVYPTGGFYYNNGLCHPTPAQDVVADGIDDYETNENIVRRIKKRRRRKRTLSANDATNSDEGDDGNDSHDDVIIENNIQRPLSDNIEINRNSQDDDDDDDEIIKKYHLKPDAKEFIPRALRTTTLSTDGATNTPVIPTELKLTTPKNENNAFIPTTTVKPEKSTEMPSIEKTKKYEKTTNKSVQPTKLTNINTNQTIRNYSESLKRTNQQTFNHLKLIDLEKKINTKTITKSTTTIKPSTTITTKPSQITTPTTTTTTTNATNQWISVSSRKKRKNRINLNENFSQSDEIDENFDETHKLEPIKIEISKPIATPTPPPPPPLSPPSPPLSPPPAPSMNINPIKSTINRKKSKQKPTITKKRVIINDIDLNIVPITTSTNKSTTVLPTALSIETKTPKLSPTSSAMDEIVKKSKKKKKINKKISSSTTTKIETETEINNSNIIITNNNDNNNKSYNFLLLSEKTSDKTNIEISHELDLIIQKGIYNNLEEKIRSLNLKNDTFFQTNHMIGGTNALRSTTSTTNKLTTNHDLFSLKNCETIIPTTPTPPPSSTVIPTQTDTTIHTPEKQLTSEQMPTIVDDDDDEKKLYPITQAVKEWMNKTRENTPEIELLKSPSTILKEFGELTTILHTDNDHLKIIENDNDNDDDDVTIFTRKWHDQSTSRELSVELTWDELEMAPPTTTIDETTIMEKSINDNDEIIEIYESNYGKNEDYLKLKAECDEKSKNFTKHGNLPYRAICCSIM